MVLIIYSLIFFIFNQHETVVVTHCILSRAVLVCSLFITLENAIIATESMKLTELRSKTKQ